jgi:predicted DNA-binding transcriptional regulator AlpA
LDDSKVDTMCPVDDGTRLVGIGDIAHQLKITRQAVDYWTRKDQQFPAPVAIINAPTGKTTRGTRVWLKRDVDAWIVEHYRRRRA